MVRDFHFELFTFAKAGIALFSVAISVEDNVRGHVCRFGVASAGRCRTGRLQIGKIGGTVWIIGVFQTSFWNNGVFLVDGQAIDDCCGVVNSSIVGLNQVVSTNFAGGSIGNQIAHR